MHACMYVCMYVCGACACGPILELMLLQFRESVQAYISRRWHRPAGVVMVRRDGVDSECFE